MPDFIKTWIRRRRWKAYGETGKKIRELERYLASIDAVVFPEDYESMGRELDRVRRHRADLYAKLSEED